MDQENTEKKITAVPVGEVDGEKTYKCEKCSNEKKESEGNFMLEGSAFCCVDCCPKADSPKADADHDHKEEDDDGVCEFC